MGSQDHIHHGLSLGSYWCHMKYGLNSLKVGYIGEYIGDCCSGY